MFSIQRVLSVILMGCAASASAQLAAPPLPFYFDTLPDANIGEVVITAQFAPTESRETVNSVRIITAQTIEQRAATNLEELLRNEANLRVAQDAVLGSSLTINGLQGQNVKILVDGVPVIGRLNGSVDAGQLPLAAVRQVEIIEGAQSLMYGSEASAGVINLITKNSQSKKLEAQANVLYENNGFYTRQARAGVQLGKFYFSTNAGVSDFQPTPDPSSRAQVWNPKNQKFGRAALRYSLGEQLDLRLTSNLFSEKITNLGIVRRPQFKPYAFDDVYLTDRRDISLHGEGKFSNIFWQFTGAVNQFDRIRNAYRTNFLEVGEERVLLPEQQDTSAATGYLARATFATQKSGWFNWLAGFEHFTETAADRRIHDSTETRSGIASNQDWGVFSSIKCKINAQLTVQGGARLTLNQRYGSALTPSVWLRWTPVKSLNIKGLYANGFRSPSLKELFFEFIDINHFVVGNPNLRPERSHNARLEVSRHFLKNKNWQITATAHGFFNKVFDRIALTQIGRTGIEYRYLNIDEWQTSGAGVAIGVGREGWFQWSSAVVRTGFQNTFSAEEANLPNQLWSSDWVNDVSFFLLKNRLTLNVWHKSTGKTPFFYIENGKITEGVVENYHLLNASVSTHFWKKRFRMTAGAKNIMDVRQIRAGASNAVGHQNAGMDQPTHWGRSFFVQGIFMI